MSDLQIGLILLGVVLILIVVLFNWWQDHRVKRRFQAQFPEADQDPLMATATDNVVRREPGLGVGPAGVLDAPQAPEVDPVTEAVIDVRFAQPVEQALLQQALQSVLRCTDKPLRLCAESDAGDHHARPQLGTAYRAVHLIVTLANRRGALTDIDWSRLRVASEQLAERLDGHIEAPEQDEVLAQARALDVQCAGLDAEVVLAVALPAPRPSQEVRAALASAGFVERDGQESLAWLSESGQVRFSARPLAEAEGVSRIELVLDLPNSPEDGQAFSRMAGVGRDLVRRLDAFLIDDQGRPVAEGSEPAIDQQLATMYQALSAAGFEAGAERTARVFS